MQKPRKQDALSIIQHLVPRCLLKNGLPDPDAFDDLSIKERAASFGRSVPFLEATMRIILQEWAPGDPRVGLRRLARVYSRERKWHDTPIAVDGRVLKGLSGIGGREAHHKKAVKRLISLTFSTFYAAQQTCLERMGDNVKPRRSAGVGDTRNDCGRSNDYRPQSPLKCG